MVHVLHDKRDYGYGYSNSISFLSLGWDILKILHIGRLAGNLLRIDNWAGWAIGLGGVLDLKG